MGSWQKGLLRVMHFLGILRNRRLDCFWRGARVRNWRRSDKIRLLLLSGVVSRVRRNRSASPLK
jgi:hypothetical protein